MSVTIPFTGREFTVTTDPKSFVALANGQCAYVLTHWRDDYRQGDIIYLRTSKRKTAYGKRKQGYHITEGDMAVTLCVTLVQGSFLYRAAKRDKGEVLNIVSVTPVDEEVHGIEPAPMQVVN